MSLPVSSPSVAPAGAARDTSHNQRIAHSTGVLAIVTGLSRLLGFVRDILIARLFGTTVQAQAFVVAFRLPNLLRDLVAEGAVTSAFVPVLSWYKAKGKVEEFWHLSQALFCQLFILLCVLGVGGVVAAPWIVRLIAPGFTSDPDKLALTVLLTRILFPFITLIGFWAYFMGLLNTLGHFTLPGLGPAILNLAMIVACVWFVPHAHPGVVALSVAVIIGGVIQLVIQVPVAIRAGFRWGWRWTHPGSTQILRLLGPRMVGSAVYQADVLIDTILASLSSIVGEGAVAAVYFANRLVQLPLALIGTASAQASLPALAEQAAHNDMDAFRTTLLSVMRMVGFLMVPASIALMVLAFPIVGGLFERGAFDHHATSMTSQALICYALGLLAYAISKVMTGAFYALHDTWTSVRLAVEALLISVPLSLALMWPLKIAGLALAATISNAWNAYRLTRCMEQRLGVPLLQPVQGPFMRMGIAALVMALGCWLVWYGIGSHVRPWIGLILVIIDGVVLYIMACRVLRVQELSTAARWLSTVPLLQSFVGD